MMLRALRHTGFAFWLGLLALVFAGVQQQQLGTDVVAGAMADAQMLKTMGHTMAQMEQHQHHQEGGHTHKGHADCAVCGATDAAAFVTVSVPAPVLPPITTASVIYRPAQTFHLAAVFAASYSSRGPPILLA